MLLFLDLRQHAVAALLVFLHFPFGLQRAAPLIFLAPLPFLRVHANGDHQMEGRVAVQFAHEFVGLLLIQRA